MSGRGLLPVEGEREGGGSEARCWRAVPSAGGRRSAAVVAELGRVVHQLGPAVAGEGGKRSPLERFSLGTDGEDDLC